MKRSGIFVFFRSLHRSSKQSSIVIQFFTATLLACIKVGPSAIGSEKGICISKKSTPASIMISAIASEMGTSGYQTIICVMSPRRFSDVIISHCSEMVLLGIFGCIRSEKLEEFFILAAMNKEVFISSSRDGDNNSFVAKTGCYFESMSNSV